MRLTRRTLLAGGAASGALILAGSRRFASAAPTETFPLQRSDAEWRKLLTPKQYSVLRQSATEAPFTSPLLHEEKSGDFDCAGCSQALFSSKTKFDSGTGWPSFWAPLPNSVGTRVDSSFGMIRTAVHCSRCGGHLGHVFDDGPKPTGLRYCMNGVALTFKAVAA